MNKYLIIVVVAVVLVAAGFGFSKFKGKSGKVAESTGNVVNITVRAVKNEWRWDITDVQVKAGDTVHLTLINEDDYDHGIGIDGYGINERMPASGTINIDFIATRKGKFSFYCSVPCGKGIVHNPKSPFDGQARDHFDMLGSLEVI